MDLEQRPGDVESVVTRGFGQDSYVDGDQRVALEVAPTRPDLDRDTARGKALGPLPPPEIEAVHRERGTPPSGRPVPLDSGVRTAREVDVDGVAVGDEGERDGRGLPVLGQRDPVPFLLDITLGDVGGDLFVRAPAAVRSACLGLDREQHADGVLSVRQVRRDLLVSRLRPHVGGSEMVEGLLLGRCEVHLPTCFRRRSWSRFLSSFDATTWSVTRALVTAT